MAAFNFPSSPSSGQAFTPPGGPQYIYSDGAWRLIATAPNNMALPKNRFVNPAFQISQENGVTGGTANGFYPADQWQAGSANSTGVVRWALQQGQPTYPYRLLATVTTAQASLATNTFQLLRQPIEGLRIADFGWGLTVDAKPAVMRICVFSNLPGVYSFIVRNSPITHTFLGSFTITAGEANTWVEKIIPIPAPPVGAWSIDGTVGIEFWLSLAVGSALIGVPGWQTGGTPLAVPGQVNFMSSTSNALYIGAMGLYLDPRGTGIPPPWEMPVLVDELAVCRRYWQAVNDPDGGIKWAGTTGGTLTGQFYLLPVQMRITTPAVSTTGRLFTNATLADHGGTSVSYSARLSASAIGGYRAYNGLTEFNARM